MVFNLHGLKFEVDSKNNRFLKYLKFRFQRFISEKQGVNIKFYVKFKKPFINLSSYEKISHNFYSKKNKFIIKKKENTILYDLNKNPIEVGIYLHLRKFKHFSRLILKGRKDTFRDYYEHFIIWGGIQNTLLALLEQNRFSVLHASAVKNGGEATLFFGLGGIGKTTVALDFIFSKNLKLLGDNFILIDGKKAYPFLEPITLTRFKRKTLKSKRLKKILEKHSFFNSYFPKEEISSNHSCNIKNIVFLNVSQNNSLIKINKSEALEIMEKTMKILGETPEFTELNMVFPKKKIKIDRKIKFYKMNYKDLKGSREMITSIL